jgi:hypothetical protein
MVRIRLCSLTSALWTVSSQWKTCVVYWKFHSFTLHPVFENLLAVMLLYQVKTLKPWMMNIRIIMFRLLLSL